MEIDFESYIRGGDPDKKEKASAWKTAIGLQAVDGLKTSDYLKDMADKHPTSSAIFQTLIQILAEQQLSIKEMLSVMNLKDRENFMANYLNPAIKEGFVVMLYPNNPKYPRQKYLLTAKGFDLLSSLEHANT